MTLKFYTNPMSRGQIVRWMLEEVGEPYEQVLLQWGPQGSASADYKSINPMMKVPTIVHDDVVVTEAAAICLYLADAFPAAKLAPDVSDRADYYRWTFFASGPLEHAVTNNNMGWSVEDRQKEGMLGYGSYDRTVDALDEKLKATDAFICGDTFTAADVYVGSAVDWGMAFGTLPKRDSLEAYATRLRERAAYKKAKAIDGKLIEEMKAKG